jgi:hypothetical protein
MKKFEVVYSKEAVCDLQNQIPIIFAVFGPIVYIHRIIPVNTIASR